MRSPALRRKYTMNALSPSRSLIELNLKNDDLESPNVRKRKKSVVDANTFVKANSLANSFNETPKIRKNSNTDNFSNTLKDVLDNKMAIVLQMGTGGDL